MDKMLSISDIKVELRQKIILLLDRQINILPGDVVAVIGPNGAGKTTLINCIINQIPYQGTIHRHSDCERLGILFQDNSYGSLMKTKELISIVTQKKLRDPNVSAMLSDFNLSNILNTRLGKISKGELQRLTLALLLYNKPELLIFDELTTGLDYEKRMNLLQLVKNRTACKTVITVTHYFEELNDWANKILMLNEGRVVFWGTIQEFKEKKQHYSMILFRQDKRNKVLGFCKGKDIISAYEEDFDAIVTSSSKDESTLREIFVKNNINFEMRQRDIYSSYCLILNEHNKSKNEKQTQNK